MGPMREWLQKLLIGIFAVIIGSFIFFQTANFAMFLVIALGIYAVLNGVVVLFTGTRAPLHSRARQAVLIRGGLSLAVGICAVFLPMIFLQVTWFLMLLIVGIHLLISGVLGVVNALDMKRYEIPYVSRMAEAVISIALALLIIFMPQQIGETLLKMLGVIVVGYGIMMIVKGISRRKDNDYSYYRSSKFRQQ